jgi:hypothetical protein
VEVILAGSFVVLALQAGQCVLERVPHMDEELAALVQLGLLVWALVPFVVAPVLSFLALQRLRLTTPVASVLFAIIPTLAQLTWVACESGPVSFPDDPSLPVVLLGLSAPVAAACGLHRARAFVPAALAWSTAPLFGWAAWRASESRAFVEWLWTWDREMIGPLTTDAVSAPITFWGTAAALACAASACAVEQLLAGLRALRRHPPGSDGDPIRAAERKPAVAPPSSVLLPAVETVLVAGWAVMAAELALQFVQEPLAGTSRLCLLTWSTRCYLPLTVLPIACALALAKAEAATSLRCAAFGVVIVAMASAQALFLPGGVHLPGALFGLLTPVTLVAGLRRARVRVPRVYGWAVAPFAAVAAGALTPKLLPVDSDRFVFFWYAVVRGRCMQLALAATCAAVVSLVVVLAIAGPCCVPEETLTAEKPPTEAAPPP